jgi:hypothetical protein
MKTLRLQFDVISEDGKILVIQRSLRSVDDVSQKSSIFRSEKAAADFVYTCLMGSCE